MTFWARLIIYAGIVLLYVGTAAWIVRAWTRKRYRDKSPSDLHYIAVGIVLVVSAGLGALVCAVIDLRFDQLLPNEIFCSVLFFTPRKFRQPLFIFFGLTCARRGLASSIRFNVKPYAFRG
jgi:hypothetical protein